MYKLCLYETLEQTIRDTNALYLLPYSMLNLFASVIQSEIHKAGSWKQAQRSKLAAEQRVNFNPFGHASEIFHPLN